MGKVDTRLPRVTLEQFHAFRDERPKEEKWELIAIPDIGAIRTLGQLYRHTPLMPQP